MGGFDPYSSSKGCAELVASAYRRSFFPPEGHDRHGVAVATARAGNVIGGGDWAQDRLVPDILRAWEAGREVVIRSPGSVRPWQHALEALSGYLCLAEGLCQGPALGGAWNFGPWDADAKPVSWIVEQLAARVGDGARWRVEVPEGAPHEAVQLKLDISKARTRLGWQPRWSLPRCLESIVEWDRTYRAHGDLQAVTLQQIAAFEADGTL
jgi:CDP-glucose 4,6-dehydratase